MAILKCKMCGGELDIIDDSNVVECEYCGSKQTIPDVDDEKKLRLYDRANKLRMACDYDKAYGVYESIVAEFPDEAEAYWGLILCKYGIEYVDDPATGKKIPTCHRSSFDSVMEDPSFEMVMENADYLAIDVYRDEAKQIEVIRKGIIQVSSQEPPYDIFVCYKETDENGDRTIDSVIAQDVFTALTDKGYRVFFSRITLEDKLGQEYEPYIFAALNSAKIMLAIGTDYKYYNAPWVKNEWSRFLKLMEKDSKKSLIPCYKNIDAYDMPKEFARLQAQDMGKVGAIQDLLRGIEKIIGINNVPDDKKESEPEGKYMQRAFISLEGAEFKKAIEFADKALDYSPNNAMGYLIKVLATIRCKSMDEFINTPTLYKLEDDVNFKNAYRFADDELRLKLDMVVEMHEKYAYEFHLKCDYEYGIELFEEENFEWAMPQFEKIREYKDAESYLIKCKEHLYKKALIAYANDYYEEALDIFSEIEDYKDSKEYVEKCEGKIY